MAHWNDEERITAFSAYLKDEEKSGGTIENYVRHTRSFLTYLQGAPITKEAVSDWKRMLTERYASPATINAMLISVNTFLRWMGDGHCRVKTLRIQRRLFRDEGRELTRGEYEKLVKTAEKHGKIRLALLMETICATGIRVGELGYITVEAAAKGRVVIHLKGKVRTILIPEKLSGKLRKFARKEKIPSGEIFITRKGNGMNRRQIWAEMKRLCALAGVEPGKVYPHNFRHLFAITFYNISKDVVRLSDVLGHSSIETTRIYLITSGREHRLQMNRLGLVL